MKAASAGKLFVVMAVCTVYFLSFVRLGVLAYESFGPDQGRYRPGTSIGPVSLSGMTRVEAGQAVADRVNDWRATASLFVRYQEKKAELPIDVFTFRLSESLKNIVNGRPSPLLVLADMNACMETVERLLPRAAVDAIDLKALEADLEAVASSLSIPDQPFDLARYLPSSGRGQTVVSEAAVAVRDESLARFLASERRLALPTNQLVSLRTVIQQAGGGLSDRAISALASAVYRAVLSTNFLLMERYAGSELPDGIPAGFEAKVDDKRDLQWLNPNSTDYTLILRYDGRQVKASLYGWPFAYQYIVRVSEAEPVEPRKIIQYDAHLAPDETVTKQTGRTGLLVKVERDVRDGSRLIRKETVSEDFYPPTYTIVVKGLDVPESSQPNPSQESGTPLPSSDTANDGQTGASGGQPEVQESKGQNSNVSTTTASQAEAEENGESGGSR
ncbi:G5 domain-containing protein [Geobacillus sp. JS12]|uniref:G5 domain-containing protein n=1 Tax=Geobacillus sp. JS12 TaxID=1813182 RepID=UPI00078DE818|nr:G5 domain-containing protein [Geobacillus sp. JS12]AMQ21334.1 hypothetical protein A0V43_11015 [Geobacillus sp. JS12]